jgi:CheY-like chemotaxis protein
MVRKALVADDPPGNLELARPALEGAGYEVIAAERLEDVLDMGRVDGMSLILLGVPLPPRDEVSCEVARAIRADESLREVPVILLIGGAASRRRFPSCLDLPRITFLATPFHPVELAALLKEWELDQGP